MAAAAASREKRDHVFIGGSAGALPSLIGILEQLDEGFPAAIFVVLHRADDSRQLSDALRFRSPLPVVEPQEGALISSGQVYLAPRDHHLLVGKSHIHVRRGPRENGFRPAIDPTFRSAALFAGHRSVGVILSGFLDDGASGTRALKNAGGHIIVQDPASVLFPDMPRAVISAIGEPDLISDADRIGRALAGIDELPVGEPVPPPEELKLEVLIAGLQEASMRNEEKLGTLTPYSCPDCKGVLWEIEDGPMVRYRCHTGHAYTSDHLELSQAAALERRLYETLKEHRERAKFLQNLAGRDDRNGVKWRRRAEGAEQDARLIEQLLLEGARRRDASEVASEHSQS